MSDSAEASSSSAPKAITAALDAVKIPVTPQKMVNMRTLNRKFLDDDALDIVYGKLRDYTGLERDSTLMPSFKHYLAILLAHAGTSPELDTEGLAITLRSEKVKKRFPVERFLDWLIGTGQLRRFARTELANLAYSAAKFDNQVYPAVAKFGVKQQFAAVAFDFSDGITLKLSQRERRALVAVRNCALARSGSGREEDVVDPSWRDSGLGDD